MKLQDALRGAADRAPVDDATVAVGTATSRVRRRRAMRTGSTGLVGAGAVAVIAFAAMGPLASGGGDDSMAGSDMATSESMDGDEGAPAFAEEDTAMADTRLADPWMCGATFDPEDGTWAWGDTSGVTYSVGEPVLEGGQYLVPNTLEVTRPVDLISSPDYVVTWDGMIVGSMINPNPIEFGPADEPMLPEGGAYERLDPDTDFSTLEQSTVVEPVNCWDSEPLPAGKYEVHQAWTLAYAGPEASEPLPVDPEPSDASTEEALPDELVGPSPDDVEPPRDDADDDAMDSGAGEDATLPADPLTQTFRVAAEPVALAIEGEPVDDPFAAYLGGVEPVEPLPGPGPVDPIGPQPVPDGYLTPDIARDLFAANRADAAWDMAAGTQRVLKVSDSQATDPDQWEQNYYGCAWDASMNDRFPEVSASIDLLDVEIDAPASISVSYGFVVDDNPLLEATVTNVSPYTIPGFWGGPSPQLYLVNDGRVVAEGYPVGLDDRMAAYELDVAAGARDDATDMMIAPEGDGTLAPAASVSGRYLWRDVSGCGATGTREVPAGIHTLVTVQSISLSNEQHVVMYDTDDADATFGDQAEPELLVEPNEDMAIAPAPGQQPDWLELQVWTSLGTVSVR